MARKGVAGGVAGKGLVCALAGLSLLGCAERFWTTEYMHGEQAQRFDVTDIADSQFLLQQQRDCCLSLAELPYQPLLMAEEQRFVIDNFADKFTFLDGESYFLAFQLPEQQYPVIFELRSLFTDSVLSPTVLLLNGEFEITRQFAHDELQVEHEKLFQRESLQHHLLLVPDDRYLVIYTSQQQQQGISRVPHTAKAYARARGNALHSIPDLKFPHAPVGNLVLSLRPPRPESFLPLWLTGK